MADTAKEDQKFQKASGGREGKRGEWERKGGRGRERENSAIIYLLSCRTKRRPDKQYHSDDGYTSDPGILREVSSNTLYHS